MIYRLTFCNKDGVEARVDIQKGGATPIYTVEGTAEPFVLFYNNDKGDKSGSFRSSGADINIYETEEFNIDELKTSSETEISVKYYINDVLQWSGFVIPDFFSKQITGGAGVVSMVASDRLSTLKGVTLSGLSAKISNRALAEMCLANTGLSLPLYTMADFTGEGVNIFNSEVLSQRMIDTKGRSISCYDILSSLLEQTNSLLIQRAGAWHIINKVQLEVGSGSLYSNATTSTEWSENTVNFSDVNVGARRTIIPVASMVGVYHEHGGGRLHPDNYDFSQGLTGWTAINGFNAVVENRSIEGYTLASNPVRMVPNYGEVTTKNTIRSINQTPGFDPDYDIVPYLKSPDIQIVSVNDDVVDINVDVSAIGPHNAALRYVVLATNGETRLYLNASGTFEPFVATDERHISFLSFGQPGINIASVKSQSITGKLNNPAGYSISIRVYGSGEGNPIFINFASVSFSNANNIPKGTMYKREQGANYTKTHEIPTVLWGDYLTNGLDGYFYEYPIDDTSSLYRPDGSLHSTWTAYGDTDQLPLLQHISRQKARMFSVAHDLLSAEIEVSNFDPLAIFVSCGKRYTVVSGRFNVLKSTLSVELEEVEFQNATVRDFIYSYFGDGESGIKSIGGISGGTGGGGGAGGGLTPEQIEILSFWKKDPDNPDTIFTEMNVYSEKEIAAYGKGEGGGTGSGLVQNVYGSSNLGSLFSDSTLTDTFNAYTINRLHERLQTIEAGGGGGGVGSTVEWGTLTNGYRQLTVEGVTYSLAQNTHKHLWADITDKPSTFTPSAHTHSAGDITSGTFAIARIPTGTTETTVALGNHLHTGVYEPVFSKNTAFNKDFGTTSGTVVQGNDSRINNGQTAYGWGNHASAGYALNSSLSGYLPLTGGTLTGNLTAPSFIGSLTGNADTATTATNLSRSVIAGNGLSGGGVLNADRTLTLATPGTLTAATTNGVTASSHTHAITTTSVGAANTIIKTDATGGTKLNNLMVGGDWKIEQIGTELLLKYNNLIAARFLSDGSIVGLGEITAYGATTGGEGVSLLRTGGTMTGNLTMSADIIMNSGRAIGVSNLPLKLLGNALTYNASNVLTEANTATQIKMGNGWTIEQTTSALTIKKNGVVKGTFNA